MSTPPRLAVVTGSNRGIGLQICRQLSARGLQVIMTSRNEAQGHIALADVRAGLPHDVPVPVFHALDVVSDASVAALRAWVGREFGRLDVLVNNAGVLLDDGVGVLEVGLDRVRATMESNFYGPLRMCQAFVPLMREHGYGRVVNVSSTMGQLSEMGARTAAYRMSKTALNALTAALAAEIGPGSVKVNSCCPGWVRTDMGGKDADLPVEQGADTPVWLATLPEDGPTGGFFIERRAIPW